MGEQVSRNWKYAAIVLAALLVLETLFIAWAIQLGQEAQNNELVCANNVCAKMDATGYYYESSSRLCACYSGQEIFYTEVME